MKNFIRLAVVFCLHTISHHSTAQVAPMANTLVLSDSRDLPAGAQKLRSVTRRAQLYYGFDRAVEKAAAVAAKSRGNTILIRKVKYPNAFRGRVVVKADIYHLENVASRIDRKKHAADSLLRTLLPAEAPYALLYAVRPACYYGSIIRYNLHAGDSTVCRVKNGESYKIQLHGSGSVKLWARTEARETVQADIHPGKVLLLHCTVAPGLFVGRPSIHLVDTYYGIEELMRLDTEM